jgi:hypothetical protein
VLLGEEASVQSPLSAQSATNITSESRSSTASPTASPSPLVDCPRVRRLEQIAAQAVVDIVRSKERDR